MKNTSKVICWEDLGCEALRQLKVKNMPLTVILDSNGGDLYRSGPADYLAWAADHKKLPKLDL